MFGAPIERLWGAKRFLKYYMLCGLGAAALQMAVDHSQVAKAEQAAIASEVDIDGVKHAVEVSHTSQVKAEEEFGDLHFKDQEAEAAATDLFHAYLGSMVGASGAIFGILLAFGMFFPNVELMMLFFPIPVKAKYFVIFYGLLELYSGLQQQTGDNVAHFAHLGGMIFGYIVIRYWKKRELFF
jgi:membrane associated rhomboid family serine protease